MDFNIVDIEEFSGEMAKIYSIILEDDEETLLDKFFEENRGYEKELRNIAAKLDTMGHYTGCRIHFFKDKEGAPGDGMAVLKSGRLRLYCLRFDNTCIFVGSGGYKPPGVAAYQDDFLLNSKAQQMRRIAASINKAIKEKDLIINDDGTIKTTDFLDLKI